MNWRQLLAMAWLRYKLSRHQEKKAGQLNVIVSRIIRGILAFSSAMAFIIPIAVAPWLLSDMPTERLLAIWNGMVMFFLFSATMTLIGQLQLNEVISIEKLLHLPVSLNGAFFINYLSNFVSGWFLILAPAMIGFTIGSIVAKGIQLLILLPALLAILFLTTSLFHQLKAIFARITQNKRNKSIVIVVIPFLLVIGFVALSFISDAIEQSLGSGNLIGDAIRNWAGWKPSAISVLGLLGLATASQFFSYRALVKFYTGAGGSGGSGNPKRQASAWSSSLLFRKLPLVSFEASAVATSGLKSIARAPEALMALVPMVILVLAGIPYLVGYGNFVIPDIAKPWLQIGIVTVTMLGFPAFLFSAFSYDRDGFRAFILSPVDRSEILYGKNLSVGLLTLVSGVVLLAIAQIFLPDRGLAFVASVVQLPACFLAMCIIGNVLSVWFPIGLKRGSMQPANAPMIHTILLYSGIVVAPFLVVQFAMVFIFLEMLVNGNFGPIHGWLYLLLSILQLLATWCVYRWSLRPLGHGLWRQEPKILESVANIPE